MTKRKGSILQRILAALLSVLLVIGTAQTAKAAEPRQTWITASGEGWELDNNGKLTIKSDEGMEGWANDGNNSQSLNVITAEIWEGVTSIAEDAFGACSRMTEITIPSSVASIENEAFAGCSGLTEITIPSGVTSIGIWAFKDCRNLTEMTLPSGLTSIEAAVFWGCENLTKVTIPSGVTSIGVAAFESCQKLEEITLPSGVTSIGDGAFEGCISLKEITIPSGVTSIGNFVFYYCNALERVTLPSGLTSIGENAFNYCNSLKEITLPSGVTEIGNTAFRDCKNLESVTMLGETPPELGDLVFVNCKFSEEEKSIHVPVGKSEDYKSAWADYENYIVDDVVHTHSWDEGEITKQPTCTETGVRTYICTVCGETKTETVEPLGHSYEWKSDEAGHWQECRVCGDKTEKAAHGYGEWTVVKPASDNDDGLMERSCAVCKRSESEVIPKTGNKEEGRIDISVRSDGKAPYVQFALSAEEAKNLLLTNAEKELLANGTDIEIILDVKDISESVSSEDKAKTEAALNGFAVCRYLDFSLYKLVGDSRTDITETEAKITVTIAVPDTLGNTGDKTERTFAVIRIHNGQSELLTDLDGSDDTVTIETDRFSTYAVVYKDTANADGEEGGNEGNEGSGETGNEGNEGSGETGNEGNEGSGETDSEGNGETDGGINPPDNTDSEPDLPSGNLPNTGDVSPLELYATLAMIAGASYLLLYFADRERGMTEEAKKELVSRLTGWAKSGGVIRKLLALAVIFVLLAYYHSVGKKICAELKEVCEK